jgi:hypothetical protein
VLLAWLNHPEVIDAHCCEVYMGIAGDFAGIYSPTCLGVWDYLAGAPSNVNPHECCPPVGDPYYETGMISAVDYENNVIIGESIKNRLKKLANIKKKP